VITTIKGLNATFIKSSVLCNEIDVLRHIAHGNANGLSTAMGGAFRKLLADVIPFPKSRQMQTARLALLKWLKSVPVPSQPPADIAYIGGLSFNEAAVLKKIFAGTPCR